jgi:hypothetical protein
MNARRPELYEKIIGKKHTSKFKPVWIKNNDNQNLTVDRNENP